MMICSQDELGNKTQIVLSKVDFCYPSESYLQEI